MTWKPQKGDFVRVGPTTIPSHEWVGKFLSYGPNPEFAYIQHPTWGRQSVRVECIRGPADA